MFKLGSFLAGFLLKVSDSFLCHLLFCCWACLVNIFVSVIIFPFLKFSSDSYVYLLFHHWYILHFQLFDLTSRSMVIITSSVSGHSNIFVISELLYADSLFPPKLRCSWLFINHVILIVLWNIWNIMIWKSGSCLILWRMSVFVFLFILADNWSG